MKTPEEMLGEAARLIDRAVLQLDVRSQTCDGCGGKRFANKLHANIYSRLSGMPDRLYWAMAALRTGREPELKDVQDTTAMQLGLRSGRPVGRKERKR